MEDDMKNLTLSLMVLATLASCGKSNAVNPNVNGISTALTATTDMYGRVAITNYITDINNNAFAVAKADSETYRFLNYTGSSGNGCTLNSALGGFLTYYSCTSSVSTSNNYGSYDIVNSVHSSENLASKKAELVNLVSQAYTYSNSSDRRQLFIRAINGDVYTIDFRVPMSANPVSKYTQATGTTRSFDYSFSGYSAY